MPSRNISKPVVCPESKPPGLGASDQAKLAQDDVLS